MDTTSSKPNTGPGEDVCPECRGTGEEKHFLSGRGLTTLNLVCPACNGNRTASAAMRNILTGEAERYRKINRKQFQLYLRHEFGHHPRGG